jgi:hypothetical protein
MTNTMLLTRLALEASLVFAFCGCVVETTQRIPEKRPQLILPDQDSSLNLESIDTITDSPMTTESRLSSSLSFQLLCTVGYDGFTLPIFASEQADEVLAVQEGKRPSWRMLMGNSGTGTEQQTVSIHKVDQTMGLTLVARHQGPLLLGRNGNSQGVLVEKTKPNGSRAIGIATWTGDSLRWLVDDDSVNAFGWISESGRLVYSSRKIDEKNFRLKVLESDGSGWELPETLPYSWILPTFSKDGSGIFAIRMGDGYGDLIWGPAGNPGDFRKSMNVHRISDRLNPERAWQTLASTTGGVGVSDDEIAWYSFDLRRLTLWNGERNSNRLFPENTLACIEQTEKDDWMITSPESLERIRFLEDTFQKTELLSGPWISRSSTGNTVIIVKATGLTFELGKMRFHSEEEPRTTLQLKNEIDPVYEYNIRD